MLVCFCHFNVRLNQTAKQYLRFHREMHALVLKDLC